MPPQEKVREATRRDPHLREKLFLAGQAAAEGLKVLPGKEWAIHYPEKGARRAKALNDLLSGRKKPEEVFTDLKPAALIFDANELDEESGFEKVSGRIRDVSTRMVNYDYRGFADFVAELKGTGATAETAQTLYDGIHNSRVRKDMIDSYGSTGRDQMENSLRREAKKTLREFSGMPRTEKILEALKLDWLCEDMKFVDSLERDQAIAGLSGEERELFKNLRKPYRKYVADGDKKSRGKLLEELRNNIPEMQKKPDEKNEEMSESMERLKEELKEFEDEVGPPGTPDDPGISLEDKDEYHTPPPAPTPPPGQPQESGAEKQKSRPLYEITPAGTSKAPLGGHYGSGRKSYFDIDAKTWSKKKRLTPYSASPSGTKRQTISRTMPPGLEAIPMRSGYALDAATLQASGGNPKLFRDQNGCFYIEASGQCKFSVEFLPEKPPFIGPPIAEDTASIYRGQLSPKTEAFIAGLTGSTIQKAERCRQYIFANHFYPGGGSDLKAAQALQHKLRTQSTGDNYIQNLDKSEYLECYSGNTLFIAMARKAGIPARLVIGHMIDSAKNGKAAIDDTTGHAWAEIWDGAEWQKFDSTPKPKPEDKKKKKDEEDKDDKEAGDTSMEKGEDDGVEPPQEKGEPGEEGGKGEPGEGEESGEQGDIAEQTEGKVDDALDRMQNGEPPKQASDEQAEQAQKDFDKAKKELEKMEEKKKDMAEKIKEADSFQDLKQLEDELKQEQDLIDDMKKELEEKLESREDEMKDKIKDSLDEMQEDGFLDEKKREELEKALEEKSLEELDNLTREIQQEMRLYDQFEEIREEVAPLVEKWFRYFAERLPRKDDMELDEDMLHRQGAINRHAAKRPRNLIFGLLRNPRVFRPSIEPRFIASIVVDVSGSMNGPKLEAARKMLVFLSELFSRISKEFGYVRFAIYTFADTLKKIKGFDQEYDSAQRYDFDDGTRSTIKVRTMKQVQVAGGTNMLPALKEVAKDLNEETFNYPDHMSALYFTGDGDDSYRNGQNIRQFLATNDAEHGFGEHMRSAVLLGSEHERQLLANIFGDEHTSVAADFETLIEEMMTKFDDDVSFYTRNLTENR